VPVSPLASKVTGAGSFKGVNRVTNTDGKLVRIESGGWAQYRQVEVQGPVPLTMLVAVELTDDEVRKLLPPIAPLQAVH
jgi:hypothetical protein